MLVEVLYAPLPGLLPAPAPRDERRLGLYAPGCAKCGGGTLWIAPVAAAVFVEADVVVVVGLVVDLFAVVLGAEEDDGVTDVVEGDPPIT